jgi:hypothetical protein
MWATCYRGHAGLGGARSIAQLDLCIGDRAQIATQTWFILSRRLNAFHCSEAYKAKIVSLNTEEATRGCVDTTNPPVTADIAVAQCATSGSLLWRKTAPKKLWIQCFAPACLPKQIKKNGVFWWWLCIGGRPLGLVSAWESGSECRRPNWRFVTLPRTLAPDDAHQSLRVHPKVPYDYSHQCQRNRYSEKDPGVACVFELGIARG